MNTSSPPAAEEIAEELAKVSTLVTAARRLLATGTMVDLSALESKVRGICLAIEDMAIEAARTFRPAMEGLIDDLDRLATALQDQHGPLAAHMDGHKAPLPSLPYTTSPAPPGPQAEKPEGKADMTNSPPKGTWNTGPGDTDQ